MAAVRATRDCDVDRCVDLQFIGCRYWCVFVSLQSNRQTKNWCGVPAIYGLKTASILGLAIRNSFPSARNSSRRSRHHTAFRATAYTIGRSAHRQRHRISRLASRFDQRSRQHTPEKIMTSLSFITSAITDMAEVNPFVNKAPV